MNNSIPGWEYIFPKFFTLAGTRLKWKKKKFWEQSVSCKLDNNSEKSIFLVIYN